MVLREFGTPEGPLFPTTARSVPAKAAVMATMRALAARLHRPAVNPNGTERWGGHALRRGGAQLLGAAGVDV
eukprot:6522243-Alexandrium_andersonii.AAC.1